MIDSWYSVVIKVGLIYFEELKKIVILSDSIQCLRKVFRPLDFFHIMLRYRLILKLIKLFFPHINLHTLPHNDKAKTGFEIQPSEILHLHKFSDPLLSILLKHLWQRLQPRVFLGMMLQAWHTCIWGVPPILLCRSCQALSGWMRSVAAQLFSGRSSDV